MLRRTALMTILLCGCGRPDLAPFRVYVEPYGTIVYPEWVNGSDLTNRTEQTALISLRAWGSNASLDGVTVTWGIDNPCGEDRAIGCTWAHSDGSYEVWASPMGSTCPEGTILAHEIGHVAIGDGQHKDPRWRDYDFWQFVAHQLAKLTPDDPNCQAKLVIFPSILVRSQP